MVDITFPLTVPINKILDVLNPRLGLLNSTEVYDALTKMVTESKSKNDLHVSIGEGDFLVSWIRRTCEHHPGKVKIGRLFMPVRLAE